MVRALTATAKDSSSSTGTSRRGCIITKVFQESWRCVQLVALCWCTEGITVGPNLAERARAQNRAVLARN
jgi:hypothetical protein